MTRDNAALMAAAGACTLTDADREMIRFATNAVVEEIDFSGFFIDDDDDLPVVHVTRASEEEDVNW